MTNARVPHYTKRKHLVGHLDVRPGQLEKLSLGLYPEGCPEPVVTLDYEPNMPDAIGVHACRVEQDGCYELIYQFQNFGQETCRVMVDAIL